MKCELEFAWSLLLAHAFFRIYEGDSEVKEWQKYIYSTSKGFEESNPSNSFHPFASLLFLLIFLEHSVAVYRILLPV